MIYINDQMTLFSMKEVTHSDKPTENNIIIINFLFSALWSFLNLSATQLWMFWDFFLTKPTFFCLYMTTTRINTNVSMQIRHL